MWQWVFYKMGRCIFMHFDFRGAYWIKTSPPLISMKLWSNWSNSPIFTILQHPHFPSLFIVLLANLTLRPSPLQCLHQNPHHPLVPLRSPIPLPFGFSSSPIFTILQHPCFPSLFIVLWGTKTGQPEFPNFWYQKMGFYFSSYTFFSEFPIFC